MPVISWFGKTYPLRLNPTRHNCSKGRSARTRRLRKRHAVWRITALYQLGINTIFLLSLPLSFWNLFFTGGKVWRLFPSFIGTLVSRRELLIYRIPTFFFSWKKKVAKKIPRLHRAGRTNYRGPRTSQTPASVICRTSPLAHTNYEQGLASWDWEVRLALLFAMDFLLQDTLISNILLQI